MCQVVFIAFHLSSATHTCYRLDVCVCCTCVYFLSLCFSFYLPNAVIREPSSCLAMSMHFSNNKIASTHTSII